MNIVLVVNGGMGKSIFATAVCRAIKRNSPEDSKLYVVTGFPEVFSGIDSVEMAFGHGQEHYFYEKYMREDTIVHAHDPYLDTAHIHGSEHVIETWCRMVGVPYSGEMPEVSINSREDVFYTNKYKFDREIMVIQTNGGGAAPNDLKYSWARDIPSCVAEAVISEFSKQYQIVHVRKEEQISYANTVSLSDSYKGIAHVIRRSSKRLFMDSMCQHISSSLGKRSTVLWIANTPKVFGYELNDNLVANPETVKPDLRNSFFTKYNIAGALNEFPYRSETDIFDVDRVLDSIRRQ